MKVFKATKKQIERSEISFDDINSIFNELKIKTIEDFIAAKQKIILIIPSYETLNKLCELKINKRFEDVFGFGKSINKSNQINNLTEPIFVNKIKAWCINNKIETILDYFTFKNRPKEFPSKTTIIRNYGEDYFTDILGLKKYTETFEDKLLDDKFLNRIKDWCLKNNIQSINQYNNLDKPDDFPSVERIRQLVGLEYFHQLLAITFRDYTFLSKEEARKICLENGIFTSNSYFNFYQSYNDNNNIKLPSDPFTQYKTNWFDFINLSNTQLFIGNSMSNLELFTYKLLYDRNIYFETEKVFESCRSKNPLPFDFYIPNLEHSEILIELDGEQHRTQDIKSRYYSVSTVKHDEIKNNFCFANNIKLIRIANIIDIEPTLNESIGLKKYPKVRDLDWTSDFDSELEILNSKLSKSLKVKLLLLMSEKNKCILSNLEIIQKVGIKKPSFYNIKNELIKLNLINRPNDFHYTQDEFKNIVNLYNQGKTIAEIVRLTGYKNTTYLIKRLKDFGVNYKSRKMNLEETIKLKEKIMELHKNGFNVSEIANQTNKKVSYISIMIKKLNSKE